MFENINYFKQQTKYQKAMTIRINKTNPNIVTMIDVVIELEYLLRYFDVLVTVCIVTPKTILELVFEYGKFTIK